MPTNWTINTLNGLHTWYSKKISSSVFLFNEGPWWWSEVMIYNDHDQLVDHRRSACSNSKQIAMKWINSDLADYHLPPLTPPEDL